MISSVYTCHISGSAAGVDAELHAAGQRALRQGVRGEKVRRHHQRLRPQVSEVDLIQ